MAISIIFLEESKELQMTDFPAIDGLLWIKNPNNVTIYENTGYATDNYTSPDYTVVNAIVTKSIAASVDIFGNLVEGFYTVLVKTASLGVSTYTARYLKGVYQPVISLLSEVCTLSTAEFGFTPALPSNAENTTYSWVATPPTGSGLPTITSSTDTVEVTPLVAGVYTIEFTVTWDEVVATTGGAESFVTYTRTATPYLYRPSCGAAADLACTVYNSAKCLEKTWFANKTTANFEAWTIAINYMTLINQSIACDDQAGAVLLYNDYVSWKGNCACCQGCSGH